MPSCALCSPSSTWASPTSEILARPSLVSRIFWGRGWRSAVRGGREGEQNILGVQAAQCSRAWRGGVPRIGV